MGKKGGAVLGRNLARAQQQTKKTNRADRQEGYLHTTDLQVRLKYSIVIIMINKI